MDQSDGRRRVQCKVQLAHSRKRQPFGHLSNLIEIAICCLWAGYGVRRILCTPGFRWAGNIGPWD
jgi:hypothetical protein